MHVNLLTQIDDESVRLREPAKGKQEREEQDENCVCVRVRERVVWGGKGERLHQKNLHSKQQAFQSLKIELKYSVPSLISPLPLLPEK